MKKLVVNLGVLCLVLTACAAGSAPAASTSINVEMTDFQFTSNSFTVPAGQQIDFTATNNGGVEHSFVIMKLGAQVNAGFSGKDQANVYWEEAAIPVGQTLKATFTAPSEPGDYQVVCAVPGHIEAGMVAKLTVVSGG